MYKRVLSSLFVSILAVIVLGASDSSARFNRLGHNMMCVCSCGQILLECNHVGCPDSERMIGELRDQMSASGPVAGGGGSAGASPGAGSGPGIDAKILDWFVAKYGATVLASPTRGGFDNVAWITPLAVFLLATIGTGFIVRRWSHKKIDALAPAALSNDSGHDPMRERIRRETEYQ